MPSYDKLLAEELDISVEELQEARSNAWDNYFDELASSGAITEEQADELKNWSPNEILSQAVEKINIVEVRQFAVAQLANVFEMDREQLEEDLSEGKTLQEIAEEQDVDTQDIRMNLRSTANDLIGMGVQAGLITEEQRTELSDAIDSLLDAFIGEDSDISDGTTQVTPTVESPDADETPTQVP